jgi:hypothetical protein
LSVRRSRTRQPPAPPPPDPQRLAGKRLAGKRLAAAAEGLAAAEAPAAAPWGEHLSVPLALTLLLGCLLTVLLSGAHLASAAGLAPWLTPSPLPPSSPAQTGKLLVYAALAALIVGSLLLIRQGAELPADRKLTARFAWLLLPGGGLYVGLDLAPAFGLEAAWIGPAETALEGAVLGGCGLLLGLRLLQRGDGGGAERRG